MVNHPVEPPGRCGTLAVERGGHRVVSVDESPDAPRWPRWVYGVGTRPDHRFSLANERTFLAWVRTSLAMLAGGVALDAVDLNGSPSPPTGPAGGLSGAGA